MLEVNIRFKKKYNLSFNAEVVLKHLNDPEMHMYKKNSFLIEKLREKETEHARIYRLFQFRKNGIISRKGK